MAQIIAQVVDIQRQIVDFQKGSGLRRASGRRVSIHGFLPDGAGEAPEVGVAMPVEGDVVVAVHGAVGGELDEGGEGHGDFGVVAVDFDGAEFFHLELGLLGLLAEPGEGGFHLGAVEAAVGFLDGGVFEFDFVGEQGVERVNAGLAGGLAGAGLEGEGGEEGGGAALEDLDGREPPEGEGSEQGEDDDGKAESFHVSFCCWLGS